MSHHTHNTHPQPNASQFLKSAQNDGCEEPIPTTLEQFQAPLPKPEHLARFQQMCEKQFGVQLSPEQALEQLMHLLVIVRYRQENARYQQWIQRNLERAKDQYNNSSREESQPVSEQQ
jgi:hypothetical protein